jgi:serine/threonine protein kinase
VEGRVVGRYVVYDEIAAGGMATVHIGRLLGVVGFARTVALKRLHPHFAKDPEFVAMFLDEARIAGRIRHPNVVATIDVVALDHDLFLVMDYVQGEAVSNLLRSLRAQDKKISPRTAATIAYEALLGLHAAHEATNDHGEPLSIVHRDVSPQNILVGVDGVSRVVDFGVAKAVGRAQTTRDGQVKGKAGYMAPEQLRGGTVDRRTDVYATAVVLWEMLVGDRLFKADTPAGTMTQVLEKVVEPPSAHAHGIPRALDDLVLRGLARDPGSRFATARDMAARLEEITGREAATTIGDWVTRVAGAVLEQRGACLARIESASSARAAAGDEAAETEVALADMTTASLMSTASGPSVLERTPKRRWRAWAYGALATASIAAAIAIVPFVTSRLTRGAPSTPSGAAPAASSTTATPSGPGDSASSHVVDSPNTPASATPPSATSSRGRTIVAPTRSAPAPPTPPPAAPDCKPPFTVDKDGYHIPKPQCP